MEKFSKIKAKRKRDEEVFLQKKINKLLEKPKRTETTDK